MLKISVPGNLPKAELNDNYDTIKKGEGLVIMGYPGTAPRVYTSIVSQNPMDQETKYVEVPDPTVTVTSVGNIVRNSNPNDMTNVRMSIDAKDSIRYAGGLTYGGNSGGPVFDMQGRVIGLHYLGDGRNRREKRQGGRLYSRLVAVDQQRRQNADVSPVHSE
jgi:V8-like Glu-specific endopeptidase